MNLTYFKIMCNVFIIKLNGYELKLMTKTHFIQEVWLGAKQSSYRASFKWNSDNRDISYDKWYSGQPNQDGNCIIVEDDGDWYDRSCTDKKSSISCIHELT